MIMVKPWSAFNDDMLRNILLGVGVYCKYAYASGHLLSHTLHMQTHMHTYKMVAQLNLCSLKRIKTSDFTVLLQQNFKWGLSVGL